MKKVIEQFYWLIRFLGFNWGQGYLETLVTPQNWTKMLRNLSFCCPICIFKYQTKKGFVFPSNFWAAFVIKSIFWLFFFSATFEHFFFLDKLKDTFWKISSNLWKSLTKVIAREWNWKIKMQSFLVNDNNLWVNILYVFYCIMLVFSLNEKLSFRWRCRKFRFRILFTS